MRNLLTLAIFTAVFMVAGLAWAAEAETASIRLGDHLIELMAGVLTVVLSALAIKVRTYFTKKTGIEIPAQTEAMLEAWAIKGMNYAKEKAHQANKDKNTLTGPAKLELALKFGLDLAEEHKLGGKAKEKLENYIHAKLGESR